MKRLILSILILIGLSHIIEAQKLHPIYLYFAHGSDLNRDKSTRILENSPQLFCIGLEKRITKSPYYGLGLQYTQFTSEFSDFKQFSFRGYQHFGELTNSDEANIDPYFGAMLGGDYYQKQFAPTVGILLGIRVMVRSFIGIHFEIGTSSSSHNSGTIFQMGITSCFKSGLKLPTRTRKGTDCPRF